MAGRTKLSGKVAALLLHAQKVCYGCHDDLTWPPRFLAGAGEREAWYKCIFFHYGVPSTKIFLLSHLPPHAHGEPKRRSSSSVGRAGSQHGIFPRAGAPSCHFRRRPTCSTMARGTTYCLSPGSLMSFPPPWLAAQRVAAARSIPPVVGQLDACSRGWHSHRLRHR